jgi:hypothetical protein
MTTHPTMLAVCDAFRYPGVCGRVGGCADAGPGAVAWAVTTMNVGNAWKYGIARDRRANIDKAIACYQGALAVRTHDAQRCRMGDDHE